MSSRGAAAVPQFGPFLGVRENEWVDGTIPEDRPCLAFHRAAIEIPLEGVAQVLGDIHAIMVGVCLLARSSRFALSAALGYNQPALHLLVHVPWCWKRLECCMTNKRKRTRLEVRIPTIHDSRNQWHTPSTSVTVSG
jgi:hypothetical protein